MFIVTDIVKLLAPGALSFGIGVGLATVLSHYLYKHRMWKARAGKGIGMGGGATPVFDSLHADSETRTPRMGGVIVWLGPLITIGALALVAAIVPAAAFVKLDILSRNQTWLPLFALVAGGLVGIIDDWFEIRGFRSRPAGGFSLRKRLLLVAAIGTVGGYWFFSKLGVSGIAMPLSPTGILELGSLFIPFFILITVAVYSGGIIDGLDGLAGGVFMSAYVAYGAIAFGQSQVDLAAFCFTVAGSILAFLWFNIPPARFYMSETGSMALTVTLAIIAFMTDTLGEGRGILVLPIVALPLFATSLSVIIQVLSKKLRGGKKVFLAAPMHHHFEALGWPSYKVTMRYWVISAVCAIIGISLALLS